MPEPRRVYAVVSSTAIKEPDYGRIATTLTDTELEEEIFGGKGGPDYQLALLAEADRRGQKPPERSGHGN